MKKLIAICAAATIVFVTSAAYANLLPSDNFDDDSMNTSMWNLYEDNSDNVWLNEINQRLELRSTGAVDAGADYFTSSWGILPTDDFSLKIDFHHNSISGLPNSDFSVHLGFAKDWDNDVFIEAGYGVAAGGGTHSFFYCALDADDSEVPKGEKDKTAGSGTLYMSYDASKDELYLSDTGYWEGAAWITIPDLLQDQWDGAVVFPFIGGWADDVALSSGDAYLDNFVVDSGTVVPEPVTVCLLGFGGLLLRGFNRKQK